MHRLAHLLSFRRRAAWLLTLGLLAVSLHALAGTGLMRAGSSAGNGGGFVGQVCSSHGVFQLDPEHSRDENSQSGAGVHDCCKLCAAAGALLVAHGEIGVLPAPTLATSPDLSSSARPTPAARTAHPPRGPPARA